MDRLNRCDPATTIGDAVDRGIRICSWKSNSHLSAGLVGDTDIDLLVAPDDEQDLNQLLSSRGWVQVESPPGGRHDGMTHYLGRDDYGKLFHLHVHDRLVLGQRYSKNYVLPLTSVFLDSSNLEEGVPRPDPSIELVVLACRVLLKYRIRDTIKDVLGIRTPGVPLATIEEIDWCLDQVDDDRLEEGLRRCERTVPPDLIRSFLGIIQSKPRSGLRLWILKGRLERSLALHRRRSRLAAAGVYARALFESRTGLQRDPRLRLKGRGIAMAMVGADGSGKTTISSELASWLGGKLAVSRYYMGSKQPSRMTTASYLAFRILRRGHREATFLGESVARRLLARMRDVLLAVHHLSVARDRLRRMKQARQDLSDGYVVIMDRYPLEALGTTKRIRLLDGPSIDAEATGLMGKLAQHESTLYRDFELPEAIMLLKVDPHIALERKPDHDLDALVEKTRGVAELEGLAESEGRDSRIYRINSNQPWPIPYERARDAVWIALSRRSV